jgi:hypothetical protein
MDITSIDNMYEDDGTANLAGFLAGLRLDKTRRLVAILPEYDDQLVLQRVDCLTVSTVTAESLSGGLGTLMDGAAQIQCAQQQARAEAEARLNARGPIEVK